MSTDDANYYHNLDPDYDPKNYHKYCHIRTEQYCFLKLYDYEECRAVEDREHQLMHESLDENGLYDLDGLERDRQVIASARTHAVDRFAESIIGYHTGELDMSGRHEHRYRDLMTRWNLLSQELEELKRRALAYMRSDRENEVAMEDREQLLDFLFHRGNPLPELWLEFSQAWQLPSSCRYGQLLRARDVITDCLSQYSATTFQNLCFLDLPSEILRHIFRLADRFDGQGLSSACRYLREIGMSLVFSTRWVHLQSKLPREAGEVVEDGEDSYTIKYLTSRPDLCEHFRDLTITGDNGGHHSRASLTTVATLLAMSRNITTLNLVGHHATYPMMQTISQLSSLRTVAYWNSASSRVRLEIHRGNALLSPQILNLHLQFPFFNELPETSAHLWMMILLCRNIRTLHITAQNLGSVPVSHLGAALTQQCNPFLIDTLERVSFTLVDQQFLVTLTNWIVEATALRDADNRPWKLTHFKLHSNTAITNSTHLTGLVRLLARATELRALVLDLVADYTTEFINLVARTWPKLEGLTLMRRCTPARDSNAVLLKDWPSPTWQYALKLKNFVNLRFFGCNNPTSREIAPLSDVQAFQHALLDRDTEEGETRFDELVKTLDFNHEDHIAAPFAAYCSTLEAFGIHDQMLTISRGPSGQLSFYLDRGYHSVPSKWDPFYNANHYDGWPDVTDAEMRRRDEDE